MDDLLQSRCGQRFANVVVKHAGSAAAGQIGPLYGALAWPRKSDVTKFHMCNSPGCSAAIGENLMPEIEMVVRAAGESTVSRFDALLGLRPGPQ